MVNKFLDDGGVNSVLGRLATIDDLTTFVGAGPWAKSASTA